MKKYSVGTKLLILILLVAVSATVFVACNKDTKSDPILVNGDIVGNAEIYDFDDFATHSFVSGTESFDGVLLAEVLALVTPLYEDNFLFITATDGTSALIEYPLQSDVYVVMGESGLNIEAPDYPAVVSIKDIEDITVVKDRGTASSGIKIARPIVGDMTTCLEDEPYTYLSQGQAKLSLYQWDEITLDKNNCFARKYKRRDNVTLSDMFMDTNIIAYFDNYDIARDAGTSNVQFCNSRLSLQVDGKAQPIFGVAISTEHMNYDVFYDMKSSLDDNEKVLVIEADGLSYQQAKLFGNNLDLLKFENETGTGYTKTVRLAAVQNIPKSQQGLASMLTGVSPYKNGVTAKSDKKMLVPDIFKIASDLKAKGIFTGEMSYIEGNSKMLETSIDAVVTVPDLEGFTDFSVARETNKAIADGDRFIFSHFHGIDDQNHRTGPMSPSAENFVYTSEELFLEIMKEWDGRVIIVSDHGHYNYTADGVTMGNHGTFNNLDMFTPYYDISNGKAYAMSLGC